MVSARSFQGSFDPEVAGLSNFVLPQKVGIEKLVFNAMVRRWIRLEAGGKWLLMRSTLFWGFQWIYFLRRVRRVGCWHTNLHPETSHFLCYMTYQIHGISPE